MVEAVRRDAAAFPSYVQSRGRAYHQQGRVGALAVGAGEVSAPVRGTRTYRAAWRFDGSFADPRCTCPVAPLCKHAFALALAIRDAWRDSVRHGLAPPPAAPALAPPAALAEADLAGEIEDWARRRSGAPPRTLRAQFGLALDDFGRRVVWVEPRLSTPRRRDAPRTATQIVQLAAELRRDPTLLAPPDLRLLRALAGILPAARPLAPPTRHLIGAAGLNRLLDSFAGSGLVAWADDATREVAAGGVQPGERLRLGPRAVDLVPLVGGAEPALRIALGIRWPDGRQAPLEEAVHLPADDDVNPSLVLHGGEFWRVAEEPPGPLARRLEVEGGLAIPARGRSRFLSLLASSFSSVSEALGERVRIHPARPLVTLDLGDDDWLQIRVFAHAGPWRPAAAPGASAVFEMDRDGHWERLEAGAAPAGAAAALAPLEEAADDGPPPAAAPADADSATLVEIPDPARLEPVREWLLALPLHHDPPVRRATPDADPAWRGSWLRLTARNLDRFMDAWEERPEGVTWLGNRALRRMLGEGPVVRPRLAIEASGSDWFAISAEWEAEGLALTEADLAKLRASRSRFVRLGGGWVRRERAAEHDAASALLADLGLEAGEGAQTLTLPQLARARPESLAALERLGADPATLAAVARLRAAVAEFAGVPAVAPPAALHATLRPYQREGLDFLAFVTSLGLGAVLADDMGLGKTVQALAWIEWLRERDPGEGPVLVVCPASVVHNWQREAAAFTPGLRVAALTGEERHALRGATRAHDLVVTSYALLRRDLGHWRGIAWRAAILDEAQMIKNPDTAVARAARELDARHRLALTGTPIENRALDLWSIMEFVNPGYLGPRKGFVLRYDSATSAPHARRLLAARLRPVLLRRLKEEVATDLPDRIEERIECSMTPGQRKLYAAEVVKGRELLRRLQTTDEGVDRHRIEVLAMLTRLRQICCHPALAGGRESLGSGKFDVLFEVLEPLLAEGRKVLLFSQFVRCLELIGAEMKRRGVRHHVLTGATTRRGEVVDAFERDPEPGVFLISLKAGGTGLNLTAASHVVLFDPWWNPAVEAQAIDRAHRIGQTRTVVAVRLLAAGTVEEKIWELQQRKSTLANEVLGEDGFARRLTAGDLEELLA